MTPTAATISPPSFTVMRSSTSRSSARTEAMSTFSSALVAARSDFPGPSLRRTPRPAHVTRPPPRASRRISERRRRQRSRLFPFWTRPQYGAAPLSRPARDALPQPHARRTPDVARIAGAVRKKERKENESLNFRRAAGRRPPSHEALRRGRRLIYLARETGLEPATSGVTGRRSNQLSYSPASAAQRIALARGAE